MTTLQSQPWTCSVPEKGDEDTHSHLQHLTRALWPGGQGSRRARPMGSELQEACSFLRGPQATGLALGHLWMKNCSLAGRHCHPEPCSSLLASLL